MQQFWPLALVILAAVFVAFVVAIFIGRVQRPDLKAKGPRHRWNKRRDSKL